MWVNWIGLFLYLHKRNHRFCPPLLDKNRNYDRFLSPWEWMVPILKMRLFVSSTAIITTRDGWNGTNFYIKNRMVSSIKMSRKRLVYHHARNVRLYYPYWQYTDLIFRFVSLYSAYAAHYVYALHIRLLTPLDWWLKWGIGLDTDVWVHSLEMKYLHV